MNAAPTAQNVPLSPYVVVPEPSTYVSMLLGMAMLGLCRYRRPKATLVPIPG